MGHSNTIPRLIADLGASKKVPPIDDDEYDNIYVISIPWFGKTKTIRLRYGAPYTGEEQPVQTTAPLETPASATREN